MNYQGPGFYRHYKGGEYEVLGLALKEDTVVEGTKSSSAPTTGTLAKRGDFLTDETGSIWICTVTGTPGTWIQVNTEVVLVIYKPLTPGSLLEERDEDFWARELNDFNSKVCPGGEGWDPNEWVPRFTKVK